jgi:uncharacterized protein YjcR
VAVSESARLTPDQLRAATLVGQAWRYKDVAATIGVHAETISRWSKREDFQKVAREARKEVMDENAAAVAALEDGLTATNRDGEPDHKTRVMAAKALIGRRGVGGGTPKKARPREAEFFDD